MRPPVPRSLALAASLVLLACGSEPSVNPATLAMADQPAAPSAAQLARLATRKVFFGHQSVGNNILDGVRALIADGEAPALNIVRAADPSTVPGPAIVEAEIGRNGDPLSKARAFDAALARGLGAEGGVALYKHCYVDVVPGTDADALFAAYRANMDSLMTRHPEVTFVHVTMPLTTVEPAGKRLVKRLLGRTTAVDLNATRNRFNRLLRQTYASKAPVFDLAALESTRPNGARMFVAQGGDTVYTMAPEWTDDGGHLNPAGQRMVARQFLALLAGL